MDTEEPRIVTFEHHGKKYYCNWSIYLEAEKFKLKQEREMGRLSANAQAIIYGTSNSNSNNP